MPHRPAFGAIDRKRAFLKAHTNPHNPRQAENDGAYGFSFIARGTERRLVNLTTANPTEYGGAGHAFLAGPSVIIQPVA